MTEGERETLAIALDHAWRWYENRRSRALTLLQTLMLFMAIMGAAYGAAIQAKLYGLAGFQCLLIAPILIAVEREGTRLRRSAELASEAIAELQDRLANVLATEVLRLRRRELTNQTTRPRPNGAKWLMYVSAGGALAGSVYTWVFLP
ncbi:hypothetical protein [Streptomyces glomeratus]|uniref:Uncharacterized protein n=1 Tax=Streptomyces glomeratus TaxID=284452 RepID=A0ABP6LV79_9ACTN|nr:hypothetical protein [Streptomyces glomeratus]MCF1506222.1 hypothetical protein [Streptomyces glomeratus]